jgi:hypothetical protein
MNTLTNRTDIHDCVRTFNQILDLLNRNPIDIGWSPPLVILTKHRTYNLPRNPKHYCAVFAHRGSRTVKIIEFNFPIDRINTKLSGVFARDGRDFLVAHRGRISGGRVKGIKRDAFFQHLGRRNLNVTNTTDGANRQNRVRLVGNLNSPTFRQDLEGFILEVANFKRRLGIFG